MRIGNLNLRGKAVLAPLAGVSNRPFRVMAIETGASLTYTEMISSEGLIRNQQRTENMIRFQADEQPIGIQLFGSSPEVMMKAAAIIVKDRPPDLVDINFGCPVRKVVNKNGGAAVLKDLVLTEEIIRAVVEGAGRTPVTIKIRTGWDDLSPVYLEVGTIAERAGAAAITLHARSRSKGYAGKADWTTIKRLKQSVGITVIGNGDIRTPDDAKQMLDQTDCDGVMLGRAALGNPFIFGRINRYLKTGVDPGPPDRTEKIKMANLHARLMVSQFGLERGMKMMRRYLGWYVKGMPGAAELRPKLFQVERLEDIDSIFSEYLSAAPGTEGTGLDLGGNLV